MRTSIICANVTCDNTAPLSVPPPAGVKTSTFGTPNYLLSVNYSNSIRRYQIQNQIQIQTISTIQTIKNLRTTFGETTESNTNQCNVERNRLGLNAIATRRHCARYQNGRRRVVCCRSVHVTLLTVRQLKLVVNHLNAIHQRISIRNDFIQIN